MPVTQTNESALSVETRSMNAESGDCSNNGIGTATNENTTLTASFESTQSQTSTASAETIKSDKEPKKSSMTSKRANGDASSLRSFKRTKSGSVTSSASAPGKAQQSLKGFLKPKTPVQSLDEATTAHQTTKRSVSSALTTSATEHLNSAQQASASTPLNRPTTSDPEVTITTNNHKPDREETNNPIPKISPPSTPPQKNQPTSKTSQDREAEISTRTQQPSSDPLVDPIASKESWTKLFSKRPPPRCEGHNEPCVILTTKKSGMNCGRAFWLCPRYVRTDL